MANLQVTMFGRLWVGSDGRTLAGLELRKVQELLAYLLLHREITHRRDTLAILLWGSGDLSRARKYLRQILWQLQSALQQAHTDQNLVWADAEYIGVNPDAPLSLDIATFEAVCAPLRDLPGASLSREAAEALDRAVILYRAELLEGWYADWCVAERVRLAALYRVALDKLIGFCEQQAHYERGISYGEEVLRHERAHERTYRHLMRLYYLNGDRTTALRQYERCRVALHEELGVALSQATQVLYDRIRCDHLLDESADDPPAERLDIPNLLVYLQSLEATLSRLQAQTHQMTLRNLGQKTPPQTPNHPGDR